jgi:S-adenosylmethionine:tRNA ribosyltransferase-isomerase
MKLSHFQFDLPKIAGRISSEHRDEALNGYWSKQTIEHKTFKDVIDYFDDGDVLILNNTKVFPHVYTEIKKNRSKNRSFFT